MKPVPRILFLALMLFLAAPSAWCATGEVIRETGDLARHLEKLVDALPSCDSDAFRQPGEDERADFGAAVRHCLAGNYARAAKVAARVGYSVVQYTHRGDSHHYILLREAGAREGRPFAGQGIYILNPRRNRPLNLQAPHPIRDTGTGKQSVWLFFELEATFLQIAGTNRCASRAASNASGRSSVCSGCLGLDGKAAYRLSDVAHNPRSFFQVASDTVNAEEETLLSVNLHGFSPSGMEPAAASVAQISNGTVAATPDSLATRLATAYNEILGNLGYAGRGAASFNLTDADPPELALAGIPAYPGRTNTQGRAINGSPKPATKGVAAVSQSERFLHLEQQRVLRRRTARHNDPAYPESNWTITRDALAQVCPPSLWIDPAHEGLARGDFVSPFPSRAVARSHAEGGEVLRIKQTSAESAP